MNKRTLKKEEFKLGESLPWSVYATDGKLLLEQGHRLSSEKQIQNLLARGVLRDPTAQEIREDQKKDSTSLDSPFKVLDALKISLKSILTDLNNSKESDYGQKIINLTKVIQKMCFENSDAILGAMILDQRSSYTNIHPIFSAALTELILRRQKIPGQDRLLYLAAALTQNLGMYELQEVLSKQTAKLSDAQRKAVNEHPYKSMEILLSHGVEHKEWLNTILYHHERPDGEGYPVGMKGDDIPFNAKVLSMTDIYSAMVLPRRYRDGIFVKKALKEIFLQRGKLVDENIAQLLIKEIGIYPPGTFVTLNNGDNAIVLKRGTNANASSPLVLCYAGPRGAYYEIPRQKDTKHQDIYGIHKVVQKPEDFKLSREQVWQVVED